MEIGQIGYGCLDAIGDFRAYLAGEGGLSPSKKVTSTPPCYLPTMSFYPLKNAFVDVTVDHVTIQESFLSNLDDSDYVLVSKKYDFAYNRTNVYQFMKRDGRFVEVPFKRAAGDELMLTMFMRVP